MQCQEITNFLDNMYDKVLKIMIKKLIEVYDQSGNEENTYI